jgi:hypothetical protein
VSVADLVSLAGLMPACSTFETVFLAANFEIGMYFASFLGTGGGLSSPSLMIGTGFRGGGPCGIVGESSIGVSTRLSDAIAAIRACLAVSCDGESSFDFDGDSAIASFFSGRGSSTDGFVFFGAMDMGETGEVGRVSLALVDVGEIGRVSGALDAAAVLNGDISSGTGDGIARMT